MIALPKTNPNQWKVEIANSYHVVYAQAIAQIIARANKEPGVVLALRSPEYIVQAMKKGQAAIAFDSIGNVIGFCVIKLWDKGKFISNSGLVVVKEFRKLGIGTGIIQKLNEQCEQKYPGSTLFSLTDSDMVTKTRLAMGFEEVSYSQITQDPRFWAGCESCPHYYLFVQNKSQNCRCKVLVKKLQISKHEYLNSKSETNPKNQTQIPKQNI